MVDGRSAAGATSSKAKDNLLNGVTARACSHKPGRATKVPLAEAAAKLYTGVTEVFPPHHCFCGLHPTADFTCSWFCRLVYNKELLPVLHLHAGFFAIHQRRSLATAVA
jgi:hypothetical protein